MQDLPITRQRALVGALLLLALLVFAGRVLGRSPAADAAAEPVRVRAAPAVARVIVVHVVGAVRRPGLYRLRDGSRVADAVARAGGETRAADLALVNLAAPAVDGAQIVVPLRVRGAPAGGAPAGATPVGPLSLSAATLEQLDELPGVGPSTAQKIVDHRSRHGPFRSVDELDAIPGIGPARLEQLRELVVP